MQHKNRERKRKDKGSAVRVKEGAQDNKKTNGTMYINGFKRYY